MVGVVVPSGAPYNQTQAIVDNIVMQSELSNFKPVVSRPYSSENMRELLLHLSADIRYFLVYPYSSSPTLGDAVRQLQRNNVRVVLMNFRLPDVETDYVIPDMEKAAYIATEHLIKKGRKRIAYITLSRINKCMHVSAIDEHFNGYKKALHDYGCEFDKGIVMEEIMQDGYSPEFFSFNSYFSYLAVRQIVTRNRDISGLVVFGSFRE